MNRLKLKIFFFNVFSLLFLSNSYSQEMLGISTSNYSGTNGIQFNPSYAAQSLLKWDINLITMDIFVDNNYIYMPQSNLFKFINTASTYGTLTTEGYRTNENENSVLKRYKKNNRKYVNENLTLRLPAIMISGKKSGFGLHLAVRSAVSVNRLHYSMAEVGYLGMVNPEVQLQDFSARGGRINTLTWGELGATYAKVIKDNKYQLEKIGITLKYLQGFGALYFNNKSFDYYIQPDSTPKRQDLLISNINADYGYTDYNSFTGNPGSWLKGFGAGMDIGYTFEKRSFFRPRYELMKGNSGLKQYKSNYKWKLGISLLDIGLIRFVKNSGRFVFDNVKNDWYRVDTADFADLHDWDTSMSKRFYDNINHSKQGNSFNIWLPSALSIQGDYYLGGSFYLNATLIQRIPHFHSSGVDRTNLLAITPRYETPLFDISMPIVLYQYQDPRIGLAARIGFFSIGTDKLGGFVGKHNFTGFDFYIAIKLMSFIKNKVNPKENSLPEVIDRKTRSAINCYHFNEETKKKKLKKKLN